MDKEYKLKLYITDAGVDNNSGIVKIHEKYVGVLPMVSYLASLFKSHLYVEFLADKVIAYADDKRLGQIDIVDLPEGGYDIRVSQQLNEAIIYKKGGKTIDGTELMKFAKYNHRDFGFDSAEDFELFLKDAEFVVYPDGYVYLDSGILWDSEKNEKKFKEWYDSL